MPHQPDMFFTIAGFVIMLALTGAMTVAGIVSLWFCFIWENQRQIALWPLLITLLGAGLFYAVIINSPFAVQVVAR